MIKLDRMHTMTNTTKGKTETASEDRLQYGLFFVQTATGRTSGGSVKKKQQWVDTRSCNRDG